MVTALIYHVQNYLTSLNDVHLNSFLSHWPELGSAPRSVVKTTLSVLTWLPDMVKAATPDTVPIAKLLATVSNHLAWGQTYLPEDFGSIFLERYGWTYWLRNNEGWISQDAGLPVYHEAWMPHAIRTDAAPLLAIYLWHGGDLAQKSLID